MYPNWKSTKSNNGLDTENIFAIYSVQSSCRQIMNDLKERRCSGHELKIYSRILIINILQN